jgi:hypothetical protein
LPGHTRIGSPDWANNPKGSKTKSNIIGQVR